MSGIFDGIGHRIESLVERLDDLQRPRRWFAFPLAVIRKFGQDRAGSKAALMAYYGFFSVFPLLLLFVSILGFVLHGDPGLQQRIISSADKELPSLSGYLKTGSIAGSGLALAVGGATALWAGLGVARTSVYAMDSIWDVPVFERANFLKSRLRALGLISALGVGAIISAILASLRDVHGSFAPLFTGLAWAGPLAVNLALYVVAFQVLSSIHLGWRDILPGAIVGAFAWTVLEESGSYFVHHEIAHASHLYGTFAVVIGLMAWIHLGAQLTLYSAEINVVLRKRLWPRSLTGKNPTDADERAQLAEEQEVRWLPGAAPQ